MGESSITVDNVKSGREIQQAEPIKYDWKRIKQYLKVLGTHHPLCGFFEDDVYKFGKVSLCKGCTAGYSGIYFTIGLLIAGSVPSYLIFGSLAEYFIVVLAITPIVILYDLQKGRKYIPRFPIRMIMGIFFVLSVYTLWRINPWYYKIPIVMFIFLVSNLIGILRYKKLTKVCSTNCGDRRIDWCPYAIGFEQPPELIELQEKRMQKNLIPIETL